MFGKAFDQDFGKKIKDKTWKRNVNASDPLIM